MADVKLLWVDIEATGLDVEQDEIVEFAAILTDQHLEEIAEFHALIRPTPRALLRILDNPKVLEMHRKSGLLDELLDIKESSVETWTRFQAELQDFLYDHLEWEWKPALLGGAQRRGKLLDTLHLAGSGVAAYDRKFIDAQIPWLSELLHYAPIDVGPSRRLWQWETGTELTEDEGNKTHRAMDDVQGHLREGLAIRSKFLRAQAYDQMLDAA